MNIQTKRLYETLLIGLRDEITQSCVESGKARQMWRDILNGPVAEGRLGKQLPAELELLSAKDREQIQVIDKALYRLQSDNYNICECCNGSISEKQLRETVLPWSTICTRCKTAEKNQMKATVSKIQTQKTQRTF